MRKFGEIDLEVYLDLHVVEAASCFGVFVGWAGEGRGGMDRRRAAEQAEGRADEEAQQHHVPHTAVRETLSRVVRKQGIGDAHCCRIALVAGLFLFSPKKTGLDENRRENLLGAFHVAAAAR